MILFLFKFSIGFIISFTILSIELNQKPIFYHVSSITAPFSNSFKKSFKNNMKTSLQKSKKIGQELFNNSEPKYYNDQVQSKRSSTNSSDKDVILENIREDEMRALDRMIKKK